MKSLNKYFKLGVAIMFATITIISSCDKQNDWLDIKTAKNDVVPETLADFQAMLDFTLFFNDYSTSGLTGADNSFLTDVNFNSADPEARNLYTWNKIIWGQENSGQWDGRYKNIAYANVILEGLQKITTQGNDYNNVKGEALFHRAYAYYNLVQLFCKTYSSSASSDLGIPLKNNSDVNIVDSRATLEESYRQILKDALEASSLLPESQLYQRPNKAAAFALLAKAYLNMGDYTQAELYATKCLSLNSQLLNFNNNSLVNLTTTYRFPALAKGNQEVLFYAESNQYTQVLPNTRGKGNVTQELYDLYESNDLRKTYFYALSGSDIKFRGCYTGRFANFAGLATNEVYLIRSECNARNGKLAAAISDLNLLLKNRYKSGTYVDRSVSNAEDALLLILIERRKELPATSNVRWEDLKRLNKEPRFQKTLLRTIGGTTYTLAPNDKRYVLPIPTSEIRLTGIRQNER